MKQLSLSPSPRYMIRSEVNEPGKLKKNTKEKRQCLLVVNNDSEVTGMLNEALQKWGYEVLVAKNGWEALVIAGRRSVDGMLVDMHMPIMDGRTMLNELRWLGYQMPVLMISSESDERILRQLLMEGAQDFFLKPFHLPSLKQVCRHVFTKDGVEENTSSYFDQKSRN